MKQLPPWLTRILALVLFAATYVVHKEGIIPSTLEWFHVNVLGALNTVVLALGSIGLSGPALWPQLAALLGNPGAPTSAAQLHAQYGGSVMGAAAIQGAAKKTGPLLLLLMAFGLSGCGITGPVPPPNTPGFTNCSDTAIHQTLLNILPDVETALGQANYASAESALLSVLGTLTANAAAPLALAELNCVVQWVISKAQASTVAGESLEAIKVSNGTQWLKQHPAAN